MNKCIRLLAGFLSLFLMVSFKVSSVQVPSGFPEISSQNEAYDNSDLRRAIETYKVFMPTMQTEAVIQQMASVGAVPNVSGMVMATSPKQQFGAPNSDTPYALSTLDLRDGPMVIELPANPLLLGIINDHNMKWIQNVGGIGPEKGKGAKHLFLPPKYNGQVPKGYIVNKSKTWKVVSLIRTVPLGGDIAKSIVASDKIKVYPLSKSTNPPHYKWINVSDRRVSLPLLSWEGQFEYWRQLHAVVDSETLLPSYRRVLGYLKELGIEKGKPFGPNAKMKSILSKAAKIAHDEMSVSLYANRRVSRIVWEDRRWEWIPLGPFNSETGDFGTATAIDIDASDNYFYAGWGTSSLIGKRKVGKGSIYYMGYRDKAGSFLDGSMNYKLTIPGPIPAGLFWSITVYDAKTRTLIDTKLGRAAVRSHLDTPQSNPDGSVDIYFGPRAPTGKKDNWIQTNSDDGWWSAVRLYSPKQAVFDGSWKLGDIEKNY